MCYGLTDNPHRLHTRAHLHGSVSSVRDAALVSHAVAGSDARGWNLADVLGGAWLLAEGQVHRRLVISNCTSAAPSIGASLLDDNLLRSCTSSRTVSMMKESYS